MWVAETDHRSVAKFVKLIPETFTQMIIKYLGYSQELSEYIVGVMTCVHCYEELNMEWRRFITKTYNKVMACSHCYSDICFDWKNYSKKESKLRF